MSSAGPSSSGGGDGSHYGPPSGAQDNPSYQNYLANQVLASMKSSSAGHMDSGSYGGRPYAPDDRTSTSIECSEKLGSLLDVIDSTKSYSSDPKNSSSSAADLSSPYDWIKHYDTTHSQFYYYNYKTGVSQWEEPEGFIEPVIVTPPKPIASDGSISGEASKGYAATFNAKTGAFSTAGGSTYWDTVGRPNDREGRQMAAFFNLNDLDRNREEARMRKKELQQLKGFDWRKYKEDRKVKRQKISQRWLYEDD